MGCSVSQPDTITQAHTIITTTKSPSDSGPLSVADSSCNDTAAEKYIIEERVLGSGSSSVVKSGVRRSDNLKVALKILKQGASKRATNKCKLVLINEYQTLKLMHSPNIVQAFDLFCNESELVVVLEYMAGGELFDRIVEKKTYTEHCAKDVAETILSALKHMHDKGYAHRDLKPENLLYSGEGDEATLKVADFGVTAKTDDTDEELSGMVGTVQFMAPEIISMAPYGRPVDVWAFGVILYILFVGYAPFQSDKRERTFERILSRDLKFHAEYWGHISPEAKDLIEKLLKLDPKDRLTVDQALAHAWFRKPAALLRENSLQVSLKELKRFQARRHFRVAGDAVLAISKLKLMKSFSGKGAAALGTIQSDDQSFRSELSIKLPSDAHAVAQYYGEGEFMPGELPDDPTPTPTPTPNPVAADEPNGADETRPGETS